MTPLTPAQRKAAERARKKEAGITGVSLSIDPITRATWEACAKEVHGLPLNQWLELAANAQVKKDLRRRK